MTDSSLAQDALAALDNADRALEKLDALCCEPGRSPRMAALGIALAGVRDGMRGMTDGDDRADTLLAQLEEAGAQIGRLQVGCCASNRLPLYAEMLESLTQVQLKISKSLGRDH